LDLTHNIAKCKPKINQIMEKIKQLMSERHKIPKLKTSEKGANP